MSDEINTGLDVAVHLGVGDPPEVTTVVIPIGDALAEFFKLDAIEPERRDETQQRIHAALVVALGTVATTDQARKLYDAFKEEQP